MYYIVLQYIMALIKDYFLKTTHYIQEYGENTILLMQVGAFFEVYGLKEKNESSSSITGSKIQDFSRICDLLIVEKKVCVGSNEVVMAGFKDFMLEKYVKKIQEAEFTAVVYVQDQQAKNATRSLYGIFSPGTYFSADSQQITNNIVCIWVHTVAATSFMKNSPTSIKGANMRVYVGAANIDIYTGKTHIFEFVEQYIDNPTTFDDLERFISIYMPSEAILITNLSQKEAENIVSYANIQCGMVHMVNLETIDSSVAKTRAKNCEKQVYQKELLERFYTVDDFQVFMQNFYEYTIAAQAFCYLLDFVYQHNPGLVNKLEEPVFENYGQRLILANHSLKQLNIIDDNNYRGKYSSVAKFLNICLTPMGKRQFNYVFLNPTTDCAVLNREYEMTDHVLSQYATYESVVGEPLKSVKDVSKLVRQIAMRKVTPKGLYQFYKNLGTIKKIYNSLKHDTKFMEYLHLFSKEFVCIDKLCDKLTDFFDKHFCMSLCQDIDGFQGFETNFINRAIDANLDKNMQTFMESTDALETCKKYLNLLVSRFEKSKSKSKTKIAVPLEEETTDYVKIHETEKNNFTLLSTKRRCKILKEQLPTNPESTCTLSYISSFTKEETAFEFKNSQAYIEFAEQSSTNNIITSFQLKEFCKNVSTIKVQMKDIITGVYGAIVEKLELYKDDISAIIQFIVNVDMLFAKASLAKKYGYCRPVIDETAEKSFINVCGLRHCLIEHLQKDELYVANNIALGSGEDGIMLYGTNAVGKTSFIKATGIAVIMAQAGLYVPATSFVYKPYSYIFTRILGNDNIFKGLSTFAVEMSELRTILRLANKNSLILGDELCSGTESISATSIFVAGIYKLHQVGSSFIFATHLHEIIKYEEITGLSRLSLKHMSVVYDREKDVLVYDRMLRDGPGTNMYGLEVCKSLSLPDDFLEMANNIRMKYNPESASILGLKTSHYSAKKVMGLCEKCGKNMGTEVHHLQHQQVANADGLIQSEDLGIFHKNHPANLMTLCEACHLEFHSTKDGEKKKMNKRVKTSKGTKIISL